jgi:hypothetical protein
MGFIETRRAAQGNSFRRVELCILFPTLVDGRFFVSFQTNRYIIPFRREHPGWLITTKKIENLCH